MELMSLGFILFQCSSARVVNETLVKDYLCGFISNRTSSPMRFGLKKENSLLLALLLYGNKCIYFRLVDPGQKKKKMIHCQTVYC
jgi:hypothetical protein